MLLISLACDLFISSCFTNIVSIEEIGETGKTGEVGNGVFCDMNIVSTGEGKPEVGNGIFGGADVVSTEETGEIDNGIFDDTNSVSTGEETRGIDVENFCGTNIFFGYWFDESRGEYSREDDGASDSVRLAWYPFLCFSHSHNISSVSSSTHCINPPKWSALSCVSRNSERK